MTVRVTMGDAWRPLSLRTPADATIADVKARALESCRVPAARASEYEVKYGGALVRDESRTMAALGIPEGAAVIVLPRRRRPVR